jgi:hypothetical protein
MVELVVGPAAAAAAAEEYVSAMGRVELRQAERS